MNVTEQLTEVETRILEGLTTMHKQVIQANAKIADRLNEISLPTPDVKPIIEPTEAVARYYDFTLKLMKANQKFAEQLVATWYPAPAAAKPAAAKPAAAKPAAKKAAKKAAAKVSK